MDHFDIDLSALDLEYGADCGAPPLAVHSAEMFCDHLDPRPAGISLSVHGLAAGNDPFRTSTPEGSSPEHSPSRPKHFKRRKSTALDARKRQVHAPPPSPVSSEQLETARGALYDLYATIQSERAETFRALTLLATENRRLSMHADNMAMHNSQLAKHVLELARIVHTNAIAETPAVSAPAPPPASPPMLRCHESISRRRKQRRG